MEELFKDAIHEITGQPLIFAAEVVQFLLLVVVIRFLLLRTVGKTLKERRERIAVEMEKANGADKKYAEAQNQAASIVAEAHAEAQRIIGAAQAAADERRQTGVEQAEHEANAIIVEAQETIKTEKDRVVRETSEHLADLVTLVTRRFIDEALTESERRDLTQKLILTRLKEMKDIVSQE
jgi:F-type H+-transporting ATPase subunit b